MHVGGATIFSSSSSLFSKDLFNLREEFTP